MTDKWEGIKVELGDIFAAQRAVDEAREELEAERSALKLRKQRLADEEEALVNTIRAAEDGQTKLFPPVENET